MGERIDVGNTHSFHHAVFNINTKYHQHCKCACGANKEKKSHPTKARHFTTLIFSPQEMIKIENQTTNKNPLCEQQWSCCLTSGGKVSPKCPRHRPLGSTGIPRRERSVQNYVLLRFYQIFLKTSGLLTKCLSLPISKMGKRFCNVILSP